MKSGTLLLIIFLSIRFATAQTADTIGFTNLKKAEIPRRLESIHFIYEGDCSRPHHGTLAVCVGVLEQPYERAIVDSIAGSAILTDDRTYDALKQVILDCPFMDHKAADQVPFQCETDMPYCMVIIDHRGLRKLLYSKYWDAFFSYLSAFLENGQYDKRLANLFKNPYYWPSTVPPEEAKKAAQRQFDRSILGRLRVEGRLSIQDSTSAGRRRN